MAKGPEGPGGTAVSLSGGGYTGFDDPGGPAGSDIIYRGSDETTIPKILGEIAVPIPKEVEGELLKRGEGTLAFCNSAGLAATRVCIMNVDAAQSRIDNGVAPGEVVVRIRRAAEEAILQNDAAGINSACIHHCQLAFTKRCVLATGEIRSADGSTSRPMTDEETLDFIGVEVGKRKKKNPPEGRWVFRYFYDAAVGEGNGYAPTKIDINNPRAVLADKYILEKLSKIRPASIKKQLNLKSKQNIEKQLSLFD